MPDKIWNATYWADRLKETEEEATPLLIKAMTNMTFNDLTIEEQYTLRRLLSEFTSYSRLLHSDMHQPEPTKPSLIERIFRKK